MINELPFLAFVYLLAATVLAFAQGDVDSPSACAVVALAVLTVTGLLLIGRRGPQTGRVLERALGDGLGPGGTPPSMPGWPRGCAVAFRWPVHYGEAGRRSLLDVYRHRSHPSGAPTLVYLHGGGYFSGRKSREARPLLHRLASQGGSASAPTTAYGRHVPRPSDRPQEGDRPGCADAATNTTLMGSFHFGGVLTVGHSAAVRPTRSALTCQSRAAVASS